jgi:galactofuranosylgalactofuranosylrhamnosyl-N-acetylglucosaminyl-diphospho-decaprenol beta-1,5/1,6-galactofuranosyltransferase
VSVTHAQTHADPESTSTPGTVRRLLQRQIMPRGRDTDVIRLYVDPDPAVLDADKYEIGHNRQAQELNAVAMRQAVGTGTQVHPDQIESRTAYRLKMGDKLSFGTYFNAFPASYWRRWTIVDEVRLTVRLRGAGATVTVYRSLANGRSQRVDSATNEGSSGEYSFDLTLKPFVDGGWYWYDVVAADEDCVVETAEWSAEVPTDRADHGTVTIGITTMNRPDFCAKLLSQLGDSLMLDGYLDEVVVMEQGKDKVVDSEFFPAAEKALGEKLRIIEQGNIGGSGGFARAQYEGLKSSSRYVMMLDDDVEIETEGIIRAVTFGDLCRKTTIVGGHMFSLFHKTQLHSWGERVAPYTFWWGSAPGVFPGWDLGARNIRSSRWLHARIDVDYNGWFMCLIPREVIADIGLSLPLFIKWDDSEYGLRAKEAGYPTVTFPGAAVWHVPWTDKNDALDWQSYFHQRNRFIAALLHSQYPRGGRLIRESFNHQVKHLVSMQYSTVELRHKALEDVLAGPHGLHALLPTTLPEIREMVKGFDDATLAADPAAAFPEVKRHKLPRKGKEASPVISGRQATVQALLQPLRQLRKPRDLAQVHPEAEIMAQDAKWHKIARYDSAIVTMPDGTAAAMYRRDREKFADLLKRTVAIHRRLAAEWDDLAQQYRAALDEITSPEEWEKTFGPWLDRDE